MSNVIAAHPITRGAPGAPAAVIAMVGQLLTLAASLKHPAFEDEEEWRSAVRVAGAGVKFRESPDGPVPYVEQSIIVGGDPHRTALREIVVGPTLDPDLSKTGVETLLATKGFIGVSVRLSTIPLR